MMAKRKKWWQKIVLRGPRGHRGPPGMPGPMGPMTEPSIAFAEALARLEIRIVALEKYNGIIVGQLRKED
jgi:hypothetical protein